MDFTAEVNAILERQFGPRGLAELGKKSAKENLARREVLVAEIREIETARDAELAAIAPKFSAAKERLNLANVESRAACNEWGFLRRQRKWKPS
jgi:hypothetical protein